MLLDRRAYLQLAGATIAEVGMASASTGVAAATTRTIDVPAGKQRRVELTGGETLEDTIIDVSAAGASVALRARTDGGDITIRNVAIRGVDTQADDTINVGAYDENATITIEHCYFGDGGEDNTGDGAGEGEGCVFVNAAHTSDLLIRNVNIANWETGIYASPPGNPPVESKPNKAVGEGGTVRIESSYLANVEKSGYKLGSTGSYVEGSVAKDVGNPIYVIWNEIRARDVDIRNRGGEAFNVGYKFDPVGEKAVVVIENCRANVEKYVVGPGSAKGSVDPNPDLTPPSGVPMSVEEAIQDSTLPNHLRIQGTGDRAPYEFSVSGDLEAGSKFDTDGTDGISGSTGTGRVNGTGVDDFYFDGRITDFAYEGDLEVYADGERVDPDAFLSREISISNRPYDQPATYRFEVSGGLTTADSVNPNDELSRSSAQSQVNGGSDTYRFSGEVTAFENDGPVDISIDGKIVQSAS